MKLVGEERWNWWLIGALIFCVVIDLGVGYAAWHLKAVRHAAGSLAVFMTEGG